MRALFSPRRPGRRAIPVAVLAAGLSAVLFTACSHQAPGSPPPALPTASVRVQPVETNRFPSTQSLVGTVRARLRASLEPKVSGRVLEIPVRAGQSVQRGQLMARLDSREAEAQLGQARAVLGQADADLKRYTGLFQQEAATRAELDAMEARQRVAQAAVVEVETMLGHARMEAPFDGVVTRKLADIGDLAQPGRAVIEMEDPKTLRFEAEVPETLVDRLHPDAVFPVRIDSLAEPLDGKLTEIAPVADPNTRTFAAKFDLPQRSGLRAGLFGRVEVPVETLSLWTVPASAVVHRGQMEVVFVVDAGTARLRLVRTGRGLGTAVQIVSGLTPGESVVTEGAAALVDGQPVTVMR